MKNEKVKILIIRLSSIGDIIQALSVIGPLQEKFPKCEIHWVVRKDLYEIVKLCPNVQKIYAIDRNKGFKELKALLSDLRKEHYTHIYDAHNNIRSRFLSFFLKPSFFIRRSKHRLKRFLLFQFHINFFKKNLTAFDTYILPLQKWGITAKTLKNSQLTLPQEEQEKIRKQIPFKRFVTLIPAAAWDLKRWPEDYWRKLIGSMPNENFILLGGKSDEYIDDIVTPDNQNRVFNLRGKLSLLESIALVSMSQMVVGCDTGLSHAADQMGIPIVFLIGPTAFGRPVRHSSYTLMTHLPCQPCSKDGSGRCKNPIYKKCMYDIHPQMVKSQIEHHHHE